MTFAGFLADFWNGLGWPLMRLLIGLAAGLLIANVLEGLRWTQHLAGLASPLAHAAHLREDIGGAFALAFVSPAAANGLLSESHDAGRISSRELMLANLFNSLPAYLVHIPTIFFLIWPAIGTPAIHYVGLTLLAAIGRTAFTVLLARRLLPAPEYGAAKDESGSAKNALSAGTSGAVMLSAALRTAWRRFMRRLPKLVCFTVPMYVLMYALQQFGFFQTVEVWLSERMSWLAFLKPQAMGIIVLHLAAEFGAAVGAAGGALHAGALTARDIVLALLVGNILSTPMRALRHQLPAYAGFYRPANALRLILANQGLRAVSMAVVALVYYYCTK